MGESIVLCHNCKSQIIMTAYGEWRHDVPMLRLAGAAYFCTETCKEAYVQKYIRRSSPIA